MDGGLWPWVCMQRARAVHACAHAAGECMHADAQDYYCTMYMHLRFLPPSPCCTNTYPTVDLDLHPALYGNGRQ